MSRVITWRKSTFSGGDGGQCVEVAAVGAIRDSKNPGSILSGNVGCLLAAVKAGSLPRC